MINALKQLDRAKVSEANCKVLRSSANSESLKNRRRLDREIYAHRALTTLFPSMGFSIFS